MKKIVIALALFSVFACQESKIGFVDTQKVMNDYQEKMDLEESLKVKMEAFGKKRDSISQSFQAKAQAFQTRAQKMAQSKAEEEYAQLQQQGQIIGQQLQQEEQKLQMESQTEMDSLISKVKKEINAYGKSNGYTYILGGGEGGSVLYGAEANDVTDPVLKVLNDGYKK
ncbi:OmpH family outer membrane protein [Cellulophaga baltica]|uniref:OmpH family outer membrane protein n=1 Tax=Cellulophaga TaxID=104264 RepID=UPI001C065B42|nr:MULTISPECIES: OmpH family outer membrane protein [Cellulophaga]MBU2995911.1 OmpH family outer membrane protein [Cellulophaga baltica]MDO6767306.1 OmpH family outer membrane protein [Cellulophaga sp. 1_MG-2023]